MVKKLLKFFLISVIVLWAILQTVNYVIASQLQALIHKVVPEIVTVSVQKARKTGGIFGLGLEIEGVDIVFPKGEVFHIKKISVETPLWWPPKYHIRVESTPILSADVILNRRKWQIHHLSGQFLNFSFDAAGQIDRIYETGELSVLTRGLKAFVKEWIEVPVWLDMLLKDEEQQFTLTAKNGFLTFYGIPLMEL